MEPDWIKSNREANERWVKRKPLTEKEEKLEQNKNAKKRGNFEFNQLRAMDNSYQGRFTQAVRG